MTRDELCTYIDGCSTYKNKVIDCVKDIIANKLVCQFCCTIGHTSNYKENTGKSELAIYRSEYIQKIKYLESVYTNFLYGYTIILDAAEIATLLSKYDIIIED